MNRDINILMLKNIIRESYVHIIFIIIFLGLAIFGYNLNTETVREVLRVEKLPDGKIYMEYKTTMDIDSKIGQASMISKDGKYHEVDYTLNVMLVFVGLLLMNILIFDIIGSIKNSEYKKLKWEIYNIRNTRIHYNDDRICWVFDGHIIQEGYYPSTNWIELAYNMRDYRYGKYNYVKFIE